MSQLQNKRVTIERRILSLSGRRSDERQFELPPPDVIASSSFPKAACACAARPCVSGASSSFDVLYASSLLVAY